MFKNLSRAVLVAAALCGAGAFQLARADVNILIIDQQRVLRESLAGRDLASQAQGLRDQIQKEITEQQNKILSTQRDLERNAKAYSPAQRDQKVKELEGLRQSYPAFEQQRAQILEASVGRAQNQIAVALRPILQQIINERRGTLMLDRQVVMYAVPGLDVTDEALKRLNNALRTVKVERVDPTRPISRPPSAPGKPPIGIVKPSG